MTGRATGVRSDAVPALALARCKLPADNHLAVILFVAPRRGYLARVTMFRLRDSDQAIGGAFPATAR
jgi:hypothetical protein